MKHTDSYTRQTVATAYQLLHVAHNRTRSKPLKLRLFRALQCLEEDRELSATLTKQEMVATAEEVLE